MRQVIHFSRIRNPVQVCLTGGKISCYSQVGMTFIILCAYSVN